MTITGMDRREFLKTGVIVACASHSVLGAFQQHVAIVVDPQDKDATGEIAGWGIGQLRQAFSAKGISSVITASAKEAAGADYFIVLTRGNAGKPLSSVHSVSRMNPESTRLAPGSLDGKPAVWVSAVDSRGFVYGLLELAERVRFNADSSLGLILDSVIEETPANAVRSVARAFVSEIEDKQWYYDKSFWRDYLDVLAMSRFNRFNLAFGFGYDFPRGVTGDYFHFPYPYLLDVPGYKVRVVPLEDAERAHNLAMLQFVAAETATRGIQFQLGIWTHAYEWVDSPHADHHIEGLTPANHAAYCRDGLALLLKCCPQISGITLRVHGESGIPEGSYPFWQTLLEAVARSGRKVEIDLHAKGIDQKMIDIAAGTGMPVKVAPKFSAEHMGLGYQQADIRELEWPRLDVSDEGTFGLSSGSRRFLRYGYGDLFQERRNFDVLFRLWPGTQHFLFWGDPATAASYGRTASFCGAVGMEICEPLTFKGREGSGIPSGRCAYLDESLDSQRNDWRKFEYTYRVWGRCLYNPDTATEVWKRFLRHRFGPRTEPLYEALANASRVLPLVTTAHMPSAANHSYWPELYTNMAMIADGPTPPYPDTPDPKCFGSVSPLDPQLFSSAVEYTQSLLRGRTSAKYSPMDVAQWLKALTDRSSQALAAARRQAASVDQAAFRQMEEDILIYIGLGRFFESKMRSAVLFEIYQQSGDQKAGNLAVAALAMARDSWAAMAVRAKGVYCSDITYGGPEHLRGDWMSRLPAIDSDLASMRDLVSRYRSWPKDIHMDAGVALQTILQGRKRPSVSCIHTPVPKFDAGKPLHLLLKIHERGPNDRPASVILWYRHVNHAERWSSMPMEAIQDGFRCSIRGEYTGSPFPLQYYFELRLVDGSAYLYPGFNDELSNQPYYVISRRIVS
jgi:hypothetical protein